MFSPNEDGVNDEFVIEGLVNTCPNFEFVIFNRYGNEVYRYKHNGSKITEPNWWDGTSNSGKDFMDGELLPVGTYFYIIYRNNGSSGPVDNEKHWIYLNR